MSHHFPLPALGWISLMWVIKRGLGCWRLSIVLTVSNFISQSRLDNRFICLVQLYAMVLENCPKSGPGSDHKQFLNHETAGPYNERHSLRADSSDEDSESEPRWTVTQRLKLSEANCSCVLVKNNYGSCQRYRPQRGFWWYSIQHTLKSIQDDCEKLEID